MGKECFNHQPNRYNPAPLTEARSEVQRTSRWGTLLLRLTKKKQKTKSKQNKKGEKNRGNQTIMTKTTKKEEEVQPPIGSLWVHC